MPTPNPITWPYYLSPPLTVLTIVVGCLLLAGKGPARWRNRSDRRGSGITLLALALVQLLLSVPRLLRAPDSLEATIDLATITAVAICVAILVIVARLRMRRRREP